MGFQPTSLVCRLAIFEIAAFMHSATSPSGCTRHGNTQVHVHPNHTTRRTIVSRVGNTKLFDFHVHPNTILVVSLGDTIVASCFEC